MLSRRHLFFFLLLTLSAAPLMLSGQSSSSPKRPQDARFHVEAVAQEQFVPYWTTEGTWDSELQLRNNQSGQPLTVTPVLRTPDGSETVLSPVTINPEDVKSFDINAALRATAPQLLGTYGSLVLRYHAGTAGTLYPVLMVHDGGHPIAWHIDGREGEGYEAGGREGIWWLPKDSTSDYLILTNYGENPIPLDLSLYDANGKETKQKVSLQARQMIRYSVRQLIQAAGLSGSYGGIKVLAPVHAGSVDTLHVLFDEKVGFSALLKMFDHDPNAKMEEHDFAGTSVWTLRAPMLALSQPDPALGFPDGTTLQPQLFVRNTTSKALNVGLRFNWRSDATTGKATGPNVQLSPYETRRVDIAALQDGKVLPADAHWSSVTLTSNGNPDEIMAVASSYDSSLRLGAQTPFSDVLNFKWEGNEWEYDAHHNSIITAGNGGTKPIKAAFTMFYNQGTTKYELEQALQPDEQMWIDVEKLVRERTPDKNGKALPLDVTSGSYEFRDLTDHGVGNLFEGKVVLDRTYGQVTYGCAVCCGYKTTLLSFDPFGVPLDFSSQNGVQSLNYCDGGYDDVSDNFWGNWSTANTGIATVDYYANHTGWAVGSTTSSTSANLSWPSTRCPIIARTPQGNDNVCTVSITGADLEQNQVNVTLSGTASGTLVVQAQGGNNTFTVNANSGNPLTAGSYNIALNRPSMPADTYTSVKATWNCATTGNQPTSTLNLQRKWIVLGTIRHSQYNTVFESSCAPATTTAYLHDANCNWQTVALSSAFVSQTEINGTGVSQNFGTLKYDDGTCPGNRPQGANNNNVLRTVSSITGQCNDTLVGGDSTATNPGPQILGSQYNCKDHMPLVNGSNANSFIKHIEDQCANTAAGCADGHVDDYSSSQACSGNAVGDLPGSPYWTADDQQ